MTQGRSRLGADRLQATRKEPRMSLSAVNGKDRYHVLIIGGGTAGVTVAAQLRKAGVSDIAVLEPSGTHWYQPLWTLVGGGQAPVGITARPEGSVIPSGVQWVRD